MRVFAGNIDGFVFISAFFMGVGSLFVLMLFTGGLVIAHAERLYLYEWCR